MTVKQKPRQKYIERLAQKLVELVRILRRDSPASDWRWWSKESPRSIFKPPNPYQDGLTIFDELVQSLLKLNPDMLSEFEIRRKLAYEFLKRQTSTIDESAHLIDESLLNEAKNHLNSLVEFEAWQDVDIPIVNLILEEDPVKLGNVIFMRITEQELVKWTDRPTLWPPTGHDIHILARIKAPGDLGKALSYAKTEGERTLNVLRALCFPFGRHSETWQIGLLGSAGSTTAIPMRINNRQFAALISTPSGLGPALLELRQHVLSKLEQPQWERVSKIMREIQPSQMKNKLLNGIQWLGESTKPDTNDTKFVKICFALETMIGGEPKDEDLRVRGITAMLAERAAFLVGKDHDNRLHIDKEVRFYYGKRSKIVHNGIADVSFDDLDNFGTLVRQLALTLLKRSDQLGNELSTVEKLEKWVKSERYTLPEECDQGGI